MNMMRVIRQRLRRFRAKVLDKLDRLEQEALANYNNAHGHPTQEPPPLGHKRLGE